MEIQTKIILEYFFIATFFCSLCLLFRFRGNLSNLLLHEYKLIVHIHEATVEQITTNYAGTYDKTFRFTELTVESTQYRMCDTEKNWMPWASL